MTFNKVNSWGVPKAQELQHETAQKLQLRAFGFSLWHQESKN